MAVAVSQVTESRPPTRAERKLAWTLRFFALLFAIGAVAFLVRPDDTVRNLDRVGALVGLPTLVESRAPVASDFWLALAVANMATIAACAWLASRDVRQRRSLVYAIVVSKLASSATGILLFVRWWMAFPFVAVALVDLPIALILVSGLRQARVAAA
jgi:hypothetical protein